MEYRKSWMATDRSSDRNVKSIRPPAKKKRNNNDKVHINGYRWMIILFISFYRIHKTLSGIYIIPSFRCQTARAIGWYKSFVFFSRVLISYSCDQTRIEYLLIHHLQFLHSYRFASAFFFISTVHLFGFGTRMCVCVSRTSRPIYFCAIMSKGKYV